ncbi:MAG: hypothetical protein DRG59_03635 [Deltaproteobacteria bacterium]|nr:MAG: hypothetical protein DRG59_03635 [Deltaproteobacteria bacterium]
MSDAMKKLSENMPTIEQSKVPALKTKDIDARNFLLSLIKSYRQTINAVMVHLQEIYNILLIQRDFLDKLKSAILDLTEELA